jgi:regulatory protein
MDTASGAAAGTRALELAYRYLNRRERTTHELRRHLLSRDLDEAAVEAAVGELVVAGYVDDARFARLFAQDKRELQQWGTARIRAALLGRGVDRDIVESALSEPTETGPTGTEPSGTGDGIAEGLSTEAGGATTAGGELERAVALLSRRFRDPLHERRERQRALGMLVRRGYELELALEAIAAHSRGEI